ncbi:hypothetical protein ACSQ67_012227 [Phaseolus vulgaris]
MISAISWIPKGVSKSVPLVLDHSLQEDLEEFIPLQSVSDNIIHALKDLHMERYDDEDEPYIDYMNKFRYLRTEKRTCIVTMGFNFSIPSFAPFGLIAPFKEETEMTGWLKSILGEMTVEISGTASQVQTAQ